MAFFGDLNMSLRIVNKTDIYFSIVRLVHNPVKYNSYFTLETNITEISPIQTNTFGVSLDNGFLTNCYFIKHDNLNPMYLTYKT